MVISGLSVLYLLSCASRGSAIFQIVADTNTTTIDYEPPEAWVHLPGGCNTCVVPPSNVILSSTGTWTNGTNIPRTRDSDDEQASGKGSKKVSIVTQKDNGPGDGDNDPDDGGPDDDDPNFVPVPVTVTFRFHATSFVLHALIPTFILPMGAPSSTNISFVLDGISTGPAFIFHPTAEGQAFQDHEVLRLSGLTNTEHVVVGSLAPESTFIVSYVNLTLDDSTSSQSSDSLSSESITNDRLVTSITSSSATSSPSHSSLPKIPKKNVVSFAAAIGSVVGLFSLVSFATCFSLFCRRRKARKRLARERAEEEETEIREHGARLIGPRPFRPRYFPGTLPPFDPDEPEAIPPAYESQEGESIMISPLSSPDVPSHLLLPSRPPLPLIPEDPLQVRQVSSSTPVSIAPVITPTLSLRRSSVISLVSPNYPQLASGSDDSLPHPELGGPSTSAISVPMEEGSDMVDRREETSPRRPQEIRDIREDETSDSESGGLLTSSARYRSPSRPDVVDASVGSH